MLVCSVCGAENLRESDIVDKQYDAVATSKTNKTNKTVCKACAAEKRPTPKACPCGSPFCFHRANKANGEPCYHGYSGGGAKFMLYSQHLQTLHGAYETAIARGPSQTSPVVDAVNACQIPLTQEFSKFLISTAVDALVDGDPNLPPSQATSLAQFGILIGNLAEEKEQENRGQVAGTSDKLKSRYRDVARIDAGDSVVPYLTRRIDCGCLDGDMALCHICHSVVLASQMKRCGSCTVAHYCSKECQHKAWKGTGRVSRHKDECPTIRKMLDFGFLV
jgi:hypothetical protein